jgi:hypothetical protein
MRLGGMYSIYRSMIQQSEKTPYLKARKFMMIGQKGKGPLIKISLKQKLTRVPFMKIFVFEP